MFKEKNLTPKQLAALTALLLASLIALSIFMLFSNAKLCITYFIVSFFSIYFLMGQLLEYFIYRKIKLIYKLISQTKATKREEAYQKYVLPKKGIDDVREDVEEWAAQKQKKFKTYSPTKLLEKNFYKTYRTKLKHPYSLFKVI